MQSSMTAQSSNHTPVLAMASLGLARGLDIYQAAHWDHAVIAVLFGLVAVSAAALIEVMWWLMMGDAEEPGN
jgi:hypothetical protein